MAESKSKKQKAKSKKQKAKSKKQKAKSKKPFYGYCSMEMLSDEVLPLEARPIRLVATPGRVAGLKATVPSRAEVAAADWVARRVEGGRTLCAAHGGAHA
jgi:hypothetical protein